MNSYKFLAIIIIASSLIIFADNKDTIPSSSNANITGKIHHDTKFIVGDNEQEYTYTLNAYSTSFSGTATMTGFQKGLSEGGALLTLHYLSNNDVEKFYNMFANAKQCPARFFNQHAQQKVLLAASDHVAQVLKNWDITDYRNTDNWEEFTIVGRCVEKLNNAQRYGKTVMMPDGYFANCRFIVVEDVQRY
jgi:hypothetical protein